MSERAGRISIREYRAADLPAMTEIWNETVHAGNAFPQEEPLTPEAAAEFFAAQTCSAVAAEGDEIRGLYILHPNNVGRCGHLCNASFAVKRTSRGGGVGEMLVRDCMKRAAAHGFRILQFNAVVAENAPARRLYERLGFRQLGVIPGGFRMPDGSYSDICPYYIALT